MTWRVLIAHADGEADLAARLAEPIIEAGYEVAYQGTMLVGESLVEEASKVLAQGGPVVLCATVKSMGTGWAHRIVNAARSRAEGRIFPVQMEQDAYLYGLSLGEHFATYWKDPVSALNSLMASLAKYYPLDDSSQDAVLADAAERRYRQLALESCDIIDLANLPEADRHLATKHLELRRIYVPLRVRIEARSTESVDEKLRILEKRRVKARRDWATHPEDISKRVSIGERLSKARKLVILGEPGSGKSTLVRWLATAYLLRLKNDVQWRNLPDVSTLPSEDWLPILIRCRDLAEPFTSGSLDDVLRFVLRKSEMTEEQGRLLTAVFRSRLAAGTALLLIDGVDEIADPSERVRFCRQIEQVSIAYPASPIVVTSRIVGYREMGYRIRRGFEHVSVSDLLPKEKNEFVRRWCALTELPERRETSAADLIKDVHSTNRIERLTGNPMLLTTLALVKRKVGKLPSRRADLYWEAVQVLLNWRSEVDDPIDHREAIPQLEYLAYAMCSLGVQHLREDQIIDLWEKMRLDYPSLYSLGAHAPDTFLRMLERRTGIIAEAGHVRHQGRSMPLFEFRHLTFQEYLAGLALVDGRYPGRDRSIPLAEQVSRLSGDTEHGSQREQREKESWSEAIRLCVACCSDDIVDEVVLGVLHPRFEEKTSEFTRIILAALCLCDEPNVSKLTGRKVLQQLVKIASDQNIRGANTPVSRVMKELKLTRWQDELLDVLVDEFNRRSHAESRETIGRICISIAETGLDVLAGDVQAFLSKLEEDIIAGDRNVVTKALLGLTAITSFTIRPLNSTTLDALLRMLNLPSSDGLAAIWAVGALRYSAAAGSLSALLKSPFADVRAASAQSLALIGTADAAEQILPLLKDPDRAVRFSVAAALVRVASVAIIPSLLPYVQDQDARTRKRLITIVEGLVNRDQVRHLLPWVHVDYIPLRKLAIRLILKFVGPDHFEILASATRDKSSSKVRRYAARGLGLIGDRRAVEFLIPLLRANEKNVREAAVKALGLLGDDSTIQDIEPLLHDQEPKVQLVAQAALKKLAHSKSKKTNV